MGKRQKKGEKGAAVSFMTRNNALKKLQISLPEFRKMCILKGIYPREPGKAPKGKDKTYYFKKDILYLMHDPLLQKFRDYRIWKRKVKKAKARKEWDKVKHLKSHKPRYNLSHLVKERYPTFVDALRDLDDALSTVALFALMPATIKIAASRVTLCQNICRDWNFYVSKTHSLRKAFVSIKGTYYQAEIMGQTITWLVPFKFTQKITKDVDYKVMLSFLEFYEVLLGFVLFKLFSTIGMKYPPNLDEEKEKLGHDMEAIIEDTAMTDAEASTTPQPKPVLSAEEASELRKQQQQSKSRVASLKKVLPIFQQQDQEQEEETNVTASEKADDDEDLETFASEEITRTRKHQNIYNTLFKNCLFWLSREVPKESLEFVIKSFGGKVAWDGTGLSESDERITHHVIDREGIVGTPIITREYIQPQYIYDCANTRVMIPTEQYKPGAALPPHLSPFVNDAKGGYIPEYRQQLDQLVQKEYGVTPAVLEQKGLDTLAEEQEDDDSDEEARYMRELEEENKPADADQPEVEEAPKPSKKRKRPRDIEMEEEADQKVVAVSLLPRKKREILQRIKYGQRMRREEVNKLEQKRKKLKTGTAVVSENSTIVYQ